MKDDMYQPTQIERILALTLPFIGAAVAIAVLYGLYHAEVGPQ